MNDKELMNKVFDKKCADELSAEELLSRSSKGAHVRSRAALGAVAAVAAVGIGAGAFVLLSGKGVETGTADPISPSETTSATVTSLAGDNSEKAPEDLTSSSETTTTTTRLTDPQTLPVENLDDGSLSMDKSVTMVRINGSREEYGIGLTDKENQTVADWIKQHETDIIHLPMQPYGEQSPVKAFENSYTAKLSVDTDDGFTRIFFYNANREDEGFTYCVLPEGGSEYQYYAWYGTERFDDAADILKILKSKIDEIEKEKYNGIWLDPGFEVSGTDTYPEGTQAVSVEIKNNTNADYWVGPMWEADRLNDEGVWEEIDLRPDIAWDTEVFKLEAGGTLSATAPIDCFEFTFTPGKYRVTQSILENKYRADDDDSLYTKTIAFEFTIK
ncbi:MAG: hypothetical protein IJ561_04140 [Ruminococcus sp.]|nr:hypothetical protein [Ruminococcus sp.]